MEESKIYNLLDMVLLREWKEKEDEKDGCGFIRTENNIKQELLLELNEKEKKLLSSYSLAIENRLNYLYYNMNIKVLNFGIKIGMELQKAFAEFEE